MKKTIFEFAKTIVLALVIAFAITSLIKPTLVKGYSMYPTIEPYSYLIINRVPYFSGTPSHGDIVVFKANVHTESGEARELIKRVIGVPGDRLAIRDGVVYRNGEALHEDYIYGGVTQGEMEEITVKEDCVFVMGDNRPDSIDSRDPSVGQVKISDILGRADLRLFPFDEIGRVGK